MYFIQIARTQKGSRSFNNIHRSHIIHFFFILYIQIKMNKASEIHKKSLYDLLLTKSTLVRPSATWTGSAEEGPEATGASRAADCFLALEGLDSIKLKRKTLVLFSPSSSQKKKCQIRTIFFSMSFMTAFILPTMQISLWWRRLLWLWLWLLWKRAIMDTANDFVVLRKNVDGRWLLVFLVVTE